MILPTNSKLFVILADTIILILAGTAAATAASSTGTTDTTGYVDSGIYTDDNPGTWG